MVNKIFFKIYKYIFFIIILSFFSLNSVTSYSNEMLKELNSLDEMYKSGSLSEDEFKKTKKIIIDKYLDNNNNNNKIQTVVDKEKSSPKSNKLFNKLLKKYQKLTIGSSNFALKHRNINAYYDDNSAKWDDNYLGIYLKDKKLICILKHPYTLNGHNLRIDIFYNLECSDGFNIKRGNAIKMAAKKGKVYFKYRDKNKKEIFVLEISNFSTS